MGAILAFLGMFLVGWVVMSIVLKLLGLTFSIIFLPFRLLFGTRPTPTPNPVPVVEEPIQKVKQPMSGRKTFGIAILILLTFGATVNYCKVLDERQNEQLQ